MKNTPASFSEIAHSLGPQIDAALDAYTQCESGGCPASLREAMRYSLLAPGKRLRPMLVLLAAQACGAPAGAALPAACAVEMIHAYSLIHDDLPALDNDDLRRGRPTCHKAFDEATAILAGDGLLTLAFEILARDIQPGATAASCCAALARAAGPCNMVGGQVDDLAAEKRGTTRCTDPALKNAAAPADENSDADAALLHSIHARKTGAMISVSLRLGALVAGATPQQIAALDAYGDGLGLAFQITDDLLDVQSSESAMGKRVRKDAARGKLTFPALLGLDRSARQAQQWIERACESLSPFGPAAEQLRAVARYVLERNR